MMKKLLNKSLKPLHLRNCISATRLHSSRSHGRSGESCCSHPQHQHSSNNLSHSHESHDSCCGGQHSCSSDSQSSSYEQFQDSSSSPSPRRTFIKKRGPLWESHPWSKEVASMIRVDHAGEFGAVRICEGQLAVLKSNSKASHVVEEILSQEREHLHKFEQLIAERRVRPTALQPIWHVAGFALGAGTAMLGPEAAMACHAAVESVISEHYNDQLRRLNDIATQATTQVTQGQVQEGEEDGTDLNETELRKAIRQFRDDEIGHHDASIKNDAEKAPAYQALYHGIRTVCQTAIFISKRI